MANINEVYNWNDKQINNTNQNNTNQTNQTIQTNQINQIYKNKKIIRNCASCGLPENKHNVYHMFVVENKRFNQDIMILRK